jgi:hypothetical protein
MNNMSNNGKLIEKILDRYLKENVFKLTSEFKESLQENLNLLLKFETKVSDIKNENGITFGAVNYKNENGVDYFLKKIVSLIK